MQHIFIIFEAHVSHANEENIAKRLKQMSYVFHNYSHLLITKASAEV